MKIIHLAAARPNFMKVAPLFNEFRKHSKIEQILVHSGQHYDPNLSEIFFKQLDLPAPDIHLQVAQKSREEQIDAVREKLATVITDYKADYLVVVGDVNSTLGGALAANDTGCRLIHVEAGLRSFDLSMPEEVNRIATDKISDLLFLTEEDAANNLKKESIKGKIFFVGNVMIDSLIRSLPEIRDICFNQTLDLEPQSYFVSTFHRPANVDAKEDILELLDCIEKIQGISKLVLPLHPRAKNSLEKHGLMEKLTNMKNLILTQPLGYLEFMSLVLNSRGVVTDSGGIQEETTFLKIPCLTIRESTERPITVTLGSNKLIPRNSDICAEEVQKIVQGNLKDSVIPPLWDGHAAQRICDILINDFEENLKNC